VGEVICVELFHVWRWAGRHILKESEAKHRSEDTIDDQKNEYNTSSKPSLRRVIRLAEISAKLSTVLLSLIAANSVSMQLSSKSASVRNSQYVGRPCSDRGRA
jgi:hypothetical protein